MGFIKDLYEILREEPEAQQWIRQNARKTFSYISQKGLFGRFRFNNVNDENLTLAERIERLKAVTSELYNPEYPKSFRNTLTFLQFLLYQIVLTTEILGRGVLISNFYNIKRILYFPSPSRRIQVEKNDDTYDTEIRFFSIYEIFNSRRKEYYEFYAISGDFINKFTDLQRILDNAAKQSRSISEKEKFEEILNETGMGTYTMEPLDTLYYYKENQYYLLGDKRHIYSNTRGSFRFRTLLENTLNDTKKQKKQEYEPWHDLILGFDNIDNSLASISNNLQHIIR